MLRPRARPDDVKPVSGASTKERNGGGGGGKGGDMATSREQIDRSMSDKRFGYYDPYTGKKVSALIDMINGGGMNAAGSDFEGGPYSGILNAIGVTPYGQTNYRSGMPEGSWRGGEIDDAMRYSGFAGPTVSAMPSGGVSDMRPRARPALPSRNNVEPINAYGAVPALPSRNNVEPIDAYGRLPVVSPVSNAEPINPYQYVPALPSRSNQEPVGMYNMPPVLSSRNSVEPVDRYAEPVPQTFPMPARDIFGLNGPQTIDRSLADRFAEIHGQIQQDLNMSAVELAELRANNREQYDRLVSIYSRYGA